MKKMMFRPLLAGSLLLFGGLAQADINVGAVLPLTGPLSSLGLPIKATQEMWPTHIAGEKVNLIIFDDASDTLTAVKNTRRLVKESQVDVILGSAGSPAVLAIAPVASETRTVHLTFAPAPRPGGPADWTFSLPQPVSLMADSLAKRMAADKVRPLALGYVEVFEQVHGANSRTQFGAHAYDALKVLERVVPVVPVALGSARPGTPEFRQALGDALETEKEIVVSHGVLNVTSADHAGFDQRGAVMPRVNDGRFELQP